MGCKYACVCGGTCYNCDRRESEEYPGEAEDIKAREMGYRDYDHHMEEAERKRH